METCQQHPLLCWPTTNIYPECVGEKEENQNREIGPKNEGNTASGIKAFESLVFSEFYKNNSVIHLHRVEQIGSALTTLKRLQQKKKEY